MIHRTCSWIVFGVQRRCGERCRIVPRRNSGTLRLSDAFPVYWKFVRRTATTSSSQEGVVLVSLANRIMVEGPIAKDKSSFIISARRSYRELFAPLIFQNSQNNIVYFYDVNAKVNWKYKNNNRFFAAFCSGTTVLVRQKQCGTGWKLTNAFR